MLRQMSAKESIEMLAYLRSKQEKRHEAEVLSNETQLKEFFRAQMKDGNG
jgi:hypothetical protein